MTTSAPAAKRKTTSDDSLREASSHRGKKAKVEAPHFSAPAEMVTFLIGEAGSEVPFLVHKEFACCYSPVLKAAFNSSFIEGETQTYRLEDVTPSAFRLLVKWLYTRRIDLRLDTYQLDVETTTGQAAEKEGDETDDGDRDHQEALRLGNAWKAQDLDFARLWIAGERLLIPRLQNAVMWAWHRLWAGKEERPSTSRWMTYAYKHTCVDSPLRHLAVDQLAYQFEPSEIAEHSDELPRELLLDLALVLSSAVKPITEADERYRPGSDDKLDKVTLMMEPKKLRYSAERVWRSYLVPEDGAK